MAIAQSDFNLWRGKAYEGQVSTIENCEVLSRKVETGLIQFGRAVIRGASERSCAPVTPATTAADIIGFSVRSMAEYSQTPPNNTGVYEVGYAVDHIASVLRRGPIFMLCVDGASAGDTVSVIVAVGDNQGRLTTGSGVELKTVKWVDDVAAGEIGEILADGILSV